MEALQRCCSSSHSQVHMPQVAAEVVQGQVGKAVLSPAGCSWLLGLLRLHSDQAQGRHGSHLPPCTYH